jgi:Ca-activated chloride channel homolog
MERPYNYCIGLIVLFFGPIAGLQAQYYLTGTTYADSARPEPYAKILLHSKKMIYQSGRSGDFGIPSANKTDTFSCWKEGFDTSVHVVVHGKPNLLILKPNKETAKKASERGRLSNLVPGMTKNQEPYLHNSGETYPALIENTWINAKQFTSTGISPNGNRASYANIRRFIQNGTVVNPHAVRLEEIVNYFSLSFAPPPPADEVFSVATKLTDCPWNPSGKLLFVNARAREVDLAAVPPANLVFLIDNSGSMNASNRMPLLKSAFGMLVKSLRPTDRVAIVTYGGAAGIYLQPTAGSDKNKILEAIDSLEASGATAGSGGIHLAYQLVTNNPIAGGNNRVIMATDGDFNVGDITEKELENLIIKYRNSGVKLTCLGVGMGNFKDSKIETLARHGNGNYAYLDSEEEAEKVMVQELSQNLYSVAGDVTIQVKMNSELIGQYRLIGYQNRKEAWYGDKANLVGGELGSGTPINIIFEIIPVDTTFGFLSSKAGEPLANIMLEYVDIENRNNGLIQKKYPAKADYQPLEQSGSLPGFMAALTMFGNLLKNNSANPLISFDYIKTLAARYADTANPVQMSFIDLVEKTRLLYQPPAEEKKEKPSLFRKKRL